MRLSIAAILALGFAESATAFTPSSFSRAPTRSTKLYFEEKPDKAAEDKAAALLAKLNDVPVPPIALAQATGVPREVFEGVGLPKDQTPPKKSLDKVAAKIRRFAGPGALIAREMYNKPKTIPFTKFQEHLVKSQGLDKCIDDPENYKFFGTDDHAANLLAFVKNNPFFAAALTESKNGKGFVLQAFDPKDPDAKDSPALFRKMMSTLGGTGHRVNIHFNKKLTKIKKIEVFGDTTGAKQLVLDEDDGEEFQDWVCSEMYNLCFFASCIHGTIHVLHYLITGALNESSSDFEELNQWAQFYAANIPDKYGEVGAALLLDNPDGFYTLPTVRGLPDKLFAGWMFQMMSDTYALVSGREGFGARGQEITPMCKDMLQMWFENPSTFFDNMMNISPEKMDEVGMLTEFRKQIALAKPFASEFSEAVSGIDSDKFAATESKLKDLLGNVGLSSNINTLKEWADIMAVTGMMHGSTISYTRAFSNANIVKWRNKDNDQWEAGDIRIVTIGLTTVTGMQDEHHVFTPSTLEDGGSYAKPMADVLEKYTAKSDEYKEAYKNEIMKDMDNFNKFGWILTDFCPTGFDGKQFTIATYI